MSKTSQAISDDDWDQLYNSAYAAVDEGRLADAVGLFSNMLVHDDHHATHYMLGLVHKYRREWAPSLVANLRAIETSDEKNEGAIWNAAIAATALGDWPQARQLWQHYGIKLPEGDGPIEAQFGVCCVRLNPWSNGETLFAQRIDPARAVLLNVPLPESGYRWGDIVLNDGARTGEREYGNGTVPVLNAMQLLTRSGFETFAVFVGAESEEDLDALLEIKLPGLGNVEDWTDTIRHLCLRCSYGTPHQDKQVHDANSAANDDDGSWSRERNLGIAAQSRSTVERLLEVWTAGGEGRWVDAIEQREHPLSSPEENQVWWRSEDEDDEDEDEEK